MFTAFEGIDGSGKSTAVRGTVKILSEKFNCIKLPVVTAEPTGDETGVFIRKRLSSGENDVFFNREMALLFAADRLHHTNTVINPALENNTPVISDRYLFSSLAYQSVFIDYEWVKNINRFAVVPDVTVFIDVSIETAVSRIEKNRANLDLYETADFLSRVQRQYKHILDDYKRETEVIVVNGNGSESSVLKEIELKLLPFFEDQMKGDIHGKSC